MKGNDDSLAHLSLSPGRVEGLSDAVFAIIMTLLVLSMMIPKKENGPSMAYPYSGQPLS